MPLVPFARPEDVQTLSPGVSDDLARLAVELVSSRIRASVHWQVDRVVNAQFTRLYRPRFVRGDIVGDLTPRHDSLSLVLPCLNLTAVTSVTVDDRLLDPAEWDATTSGIVWLHHLRPERKASVVYTGGYVRQPEDEAPGIFRDVCLDLAVRLASNPERLASYSISGDSETMGGEFDIDEDHRLDAYRVDA